MSKNVWMVSTAAVVIIIALGAASPAFAQAPVPPSPLPGDGTLFDGSTVGSLPEVPGASQIYSAASAPVTPPAAIPTEDSPSLYNGANSQYSVIYKYMIKYLASELGIKRYVLQARLAAGETLYQIAESQGYTASQAADLLSDAYSEAIQSALSAGVITRQQANWLTQNSGQVGHYGVFFSNYQANAYPLIPGQ